MCVSAEYLPHSAATIARAYTDLRPATADLAAHAVVDATDGPVGADVRPGRFLSISQALFEVGDKAEIEIAYGDTLPRDALWAYLVSSKYREIMAPNLSMMYQVPAVDGYDGGLLPLKHFIDFSQLLCLAGRWMAGCARTSQLSPISAGSTCLGWPTWSRTRPPMPG